MPRVVFQFTITNTLITAIEMLADPEHVRELDVTPLESNDQATKSEP